MSTDGQLGYSLYFGANIYIHVSLMKDHMKMKLMMTYELSSESIKCAIKIPDTYHF